MWESMPATDSLCMHQLPRLVSLFPAQHIVRFFRSEEFSKTIYDRDHRGGWEISRFIIGKLRVRETNLATPRSSFFYAIGNSYLHFQCFVYLVQKEGYTFFFYTTWRNRLSTLQKGIFQREMDLYTGLSTLSTAFWPDWYSVFMVTERTNVLWSCHEKTFFGNITTKTLDFWGVKKEETWLMNCCNK